MLVILKNSVPSKYLIFKHLLIVFSFKPTLV